MTRALLATYEPALFLLAALGWAVWELWSVRSGKRDVRRADAGEPPEEDQDRADPSPRAAGRRAGSS